MSAANSNKCKLCKVEVQVPNLKELIGELYCEDCKKSMNNSAQIMLNSEEVLNNALAKADEIKTTLVNRISELTDENDRLKTVLSDYRKDKETMRLEMKKEKVNFQEELENFKKTAEKKLDDFLGENHQLRSDLRIVQDSLEHTNKERALLCNMVSDLNKQISDLKANAAKNDQEVSKVDIKSTNETAVKSVLAQIEADRLKQRTEAIQHARANAAIANANLQSLTEKLRQAGSVDVKKILAEINQTMESLSIVEAHLFGT